MSVGRGAASKFLTMALLRLSAIIPVSIHRPAMRKLEAKNQKIENIFYESKETKSFNSQVRNL
jgi:hypothetical protein